LPFTSGAMDDVRFHKAEVGQELLEPFPIVALTLAALVESILQIARDPLVKQGHAGRVPVDTIVVVAACQFGIQQSKQNGQAQVFVLLAPELDTLEGVLQAFAGGALINMRFARSVGLCSRSNL
jgi:hypothetical protein